MSRIIVSEKELAAAVAGWIGKLPSSVTERYVEHQVLKLYKRQNGEVRINGELGQLIAQQLVAAGWEVTYPEPKHLGSPPPCSRQ